MEKINIYGENQKLLKSVLSNEDFEITKEEPEIIICLGGDGTFLESERKFPGIPKLFIKHKKKAPSKKILSNIFRNLREGKYKMHTEKKVHCLVNGFEMVGLNDVNIHYTPPCALRLSVNINKKKITPHIICDGAVIATPYGRTGYFSSITNKKFKKGMGLVFNNPTRKHKPIIVNESDTIKIKILRGKGVVAVDCFPNLVQVKENDEIQIKEAVSQANLIQIKGMQKKIINY
ncbi:MAG: hypothetical protein U9Q69_05810 [Nanoarchaeota archaeon]|nr:hypothetical protein [Nanoarchaeota archaeon]